MWLNKGHPQISENKPRSLYFSKALFEWFIFGGAYIRRGLSTEGNLRFKIDWASLIVAIKFTVFALLYFVFEGNFQVQAPGGAYIWRGDLTEGFCVTSLGGLFSEFYCIFKTWNGESRNGNGERGLFKSGNL